MTILKAWFIEEVELPDGSIGRRQSEIEFDNTTGEWIRPTERLSETGSALWDSTMTQLKDVEGQDVSKMIHPVTLMDFCNFADAPLSMQSLPNFNSFEPLRKKK